MPNYIVKSGDNWFSIAGNIYGDQRMFAALQRANPNVPLTLQPGTRLVLPRKQDKPYVSPNEIARSRARGGRGWRAGAGQGLGPAGGPADLNLQGLDWNKIITNMRRYGTPEQVEMWSQLALLSGEAGTGVAPHEDPNFPGWLQQSDQAQADAVRRQEEQVLYEQALRLGLYGEVEDAVASQQSVYTNRMEMIENVAENLEITPEEAERLVKDWEENKHEYWRLSEVERRTPVGDVDAHEQERLAEIQRGQQLVDIPTEVPPTISERDPSTIYPRFADVEDQMVTDQAEPLTGVGFVDLYGRDAIFRTPNSWWERGLRALGHVGKLSIASRHRIEVEADAGPLMSTIHYTWKFITTYTSAWYWNLRRYENFVYINAETGRRVPAALARENMPPTSRDPSTVYPRFEGGEEFVTRPEMGAEFMVGDTPVIRIPHRDWQWQMAATAQHRLKEAWATLVDPASRTEIESPEATPWMALSAAEVHERQDEKDAALAASALDRHQAFAHIQNLRTLDTMIPYAASDDEYNGLIAQRQEAWDEAQRLMRSSIEADMRYASIGDWWWAATWMEDPASKERFIQAWIDTTLGAGRSLTTYELLALKDNFVNASTELISEIWLDPLNILPMEWLAPLTKPILSFSKTAIKWPFKVIGRLGTEIAERLPAKVPAILKAPFQIIAGMNDSLTNYAVGSFAHKLRNMGYNGFKSIADITTSVTGPRGSGSFVDILQDYLTIIKSRAALPGKVTMDEIADLFGAHLRIPRTLQNPRIVDGFIEIVRVGMRENAPDIVRWLDSDKMAAKAEDIYNTIFNEAVTKKLKEFAAWTDDMFVDAYGHVLTSDEQRRIAAELARVAVEDPHVVATELANFIRTAVRRAHRPDMTLNLMDDSILYNVLNRMDALTPKTKQFLRWWIPTSTHYRNTWVRAVLGTSPRWVMRNIVDSTFRGVINGMSLADDFGTIYKTLFNLLPEEVFQADLLQTYVLEGLQRKGSVMARLMSGEVSSLSWLSFFKEAWPKHADVFLPKQITRSAIDAFFNVNAAVESTLRLRLATTHFFKVFTPLNDNALMAMVAELTVRGADDDLIGLFTSAWTRSGGNAEKLREYMLQLAGQGRAGRKVFSLLLPDELSGGIDDILLRAGLTPYERNIFLEGIHDQLDELLEIARVRRQPPDLDEFFGRIIDDIQDEDYLRDVIERGRQLIQQEDPVGAAARAADEIPEVGGRAVAEAVDEVTEEAPEAVAAVVDDIDDAATRAAAEMGVDREAFNMADEFETPVYGGFSPEYYEQGRIHAETMARFHKAGTEVAERQLFVAQVSENVRLFRDYVKRWLVEDFIQPLSTWGATRTARWKAVEDIYSRIYTRLSDSVGGLTASVLDPSTPAEFFSDVTNLPTFRQLLDDAGIRVVIDGSELTNIHLSNELSHVYGFSSTYNLGLFTDRFFGPGVTPRNVGELFDLPYTAIVHESLGEVVEEAAGVVGGGVTRIPPRVIRRITPSKDDLYIVVQSGDDEYTLHVFDDITNDPKGTMPLGSAEEAEEQIASNFGKSGTFEFIGNEIPTGYDIPAFGPEPFPDRLAILTGPYDEIDDPLVRAEIQGAGHQMRLDWRDARRNQTTLPSWYHRVSPNKTAVYNDTVVREAMRNVTEGLDAKAIQWFNPVDGSYHTIRADAIQTCMDRIRGEIAEGIQETPYMRYFLRGEGMGDAADDIERGLRQLIGSEGAIAQERALWEAHVQSRNLPPAALNRDEWVVALRQKIDDRLLSGWTDDELWALKYDLFEAEYWDLWLGQYADGLGLPPRPDFDSLPVPWPAHQMPEGWKVALAMGEHVEGRQDALLRAARIWRDYLEGAVDDGALFIHPLAGDNLDIISGVMDDAMAAKQRAAEIALYGSGGEIVDEIGGAIDGAIPFTNDVMLDYFQYGSFDNMMRNIWPFWMFHSRSIPMWINFLSTRPRYAAFYSRYMQYTERVQRQEGLVTRTGNTLPSLSGYLRIPGTQSWIDPTSPFSMRMALPRAPKFWIEDLGDMTMGQQIATYVYDIGEYFGLSMPPWISVILQNPMINALDPNEMMPYSLIPNMDLLPAWWEDWIQEKLHVLSHPALSWLWRKREPWHDYMVERHLDAQTLEAIRADPANAPQYINRLQDAIGYPGIEGYMENGMTPREDSEFWQEGVREIDNQRTLMRWIGYFTGWYPKMFTDAEADLIRLRTDVNTLRDGINNAVNSQIFGLDPDIEERWARYQDKRWNTDEGWIFNFYNSMGWVRTPDDEQAYGMERRDIMAQTFHEDAVTGAMYDSIRVAGAWKDEQLAGIPIGANAEQRSLVRQMYYQQLRDIETNPMYLDARRRSYTGYKPISMIEDSIQNTFMTWVLQTKPKRDYTGGESYNEWQERVAEWEEELDLVVADLLPSFQIVVFDYATGGQGLSPDFIPMIMSGEVPQEYADRVLEVQQMIDKITGGFNVDAITQWQMEHDSPLDALNAAFEAILIQPMWESFEGLTNEERVLAERTFFEQNPGPPPSDALVAWVQENYPDRWSDEELMGYCDVGVGTAEERLEPRTAEEAQDDIIWGILTAAGPSNQAFNEELARVLGDDDDLTFWYKSGGNMDAWHDPEEFKRFYDGIITAATRLGVTPATDEQLAAMNSARIANEKFVAYTDQKYGSDFLDLTMPAYYRAWSGEQKKMKKLDPRIEEYLEIKDAFGRAFPFWSRFYREHIYEEHIKEEVGLPPELWSLVGITPGRETPTTPSGFTDTVSRDLLAEINDLIQLDKPMSNYAEAYLMQLAERHPEWIEFIKGILGKQRNVR